jgi:hypothetical protein
MFMSNSIVSIRSGLIIFFLVAAMTGCNGGGSPTQGSLAGRSDKAGARLDSYGIVERDAIRVRKDALRNRLWVLTLGEVRVYDSTGAKMQLIRKVVLPNWSVVGFRDVCLPDMALDQAGSAFVSNNGQARLLRIDANSFSLKDYDISFQGKERWDIGFGALAFDATGTLLARTTPGGMLWKIDVNKASAVMIEPDRKLPADECTVTA